MTKPLFTALTLIAGLFILAGCATLSREECVRGDWYQIGVSDGQAGEEMSRLDRHRSACEGTGAPVDEGTYRAGRDIGLQSYCTPVFGYRVGADGQSYNNVCPAFSEPRFLQGYVLGQQVEVAQSELRAAERAVSRVRTSIGELERERDDAERTLDLSEEASARSNARTALQSIRRDLQRLDVRLRDAEDLELSRQHNVRLVRERTFAQMQTIL